MKGNPKGAKAGRCPRNGFYHHQYEAAQRHPTMPSVVLVWRCVRCGKVRDTGTARGTAARTS